MKSVVEFLVMKLNRITRIRSGDIKFQLLHLPDIVLVPV